MLMPPKSIIIACDVDIDIFTKILKETLDIDQVGGYQIPAFLCLRYGLEEISNRAKQTGKVVVYENGSLGLSRPDDSESFSELLKQADVDATTLFPISGMEVGSVWIKSLRNVGITPIVRGLQTYPGYTIQEGGYIGPQSWREIYDDSVNLGVRHLQVPANRPHEVLELRRNIEALENPEIKGISPGRKIEITWYPTGFGKQGGDIRKAQEFFGENFHPIVGGQIYESSNIRDSVLWFLDNMNSK